ncbi:Uridine-cytidine kinase-like 1 [Portunus trituberculatus]|uniref:uridine/cytidine kinase n=1 Tax=Portunus trituberculatus TaxID=210409 RepID=A0A5B7D7U0_PORTR|nr:Uridine-cytidine kinase-like 1 [Portunus trituberculatus]
MSGRFNRDPPSSASSDSGGEDTVAPQMDEEESITDHGEVEVTSTPNSPRPPSAGPPQTPTQGALRSPRTRRQRSTSQSQPSRSREPILRGRRRTIYTAGRPPWYDCQGQLVEPFVLTEKHHEEAARNEYNFDHPDAFDFELVAKTLVRLKEGKKVEVPIYNFVTHCRETKTKTMYGANVIIFEGILAFYSPDVLKLLDMKVFVDTDSDERLVRRLQRDIAERGRELDGVLKQYFKFVKPAFDYYIAPSMVHADIIVPRGGENEVAINLIAQNVMTQLQQRGFKLREKLANTNFGMARPSSLHLLPSTPQIRGLHTFIRNKDTPRDEFIFYSKRLIRLVIEHALALLPFRDITVETPQGIPYEGKHIATEKICGVSILRAGETMENALCEVLKDVRIGKILIQTNLDTGEPELYYLRLPKDIKDYHIFLMDATVATGAAAIMAIRVLLDHEVIEEHISLCSLLMTEQGKR